MTSCKTLSTEELANATYATFSNSGVRVDIEGYMADRRKSDDKQGPSVAICTMDANGRIRFGGSDGHVQAMITAIAERYCEGLTDRE